MPRFSTLSLLRFVGYSRRDRRSAMTPLSHVGAPPLQLWSMTYDILSRRG